MNGDPTGSTGLVADDRSGAADHPPGHWSGALDRTADLIEAAFRTLLYCNNFEAQEARRFLREAQGHLFSVLDEGSAREGQRGSEGVHGEDPQASQVAIKELIAANDDHYPV